MRYSYVLLAFSVVLASACKPVKKPTQEPDPCADGGTGGTQPSGGGMIVCDGLAPIDGLGNFADDAGLESDY